MVWAEGVGCLGVFLCFSTVCLRPVFFPHRLPFTSVWTCGCGSSVCNSGEVHLHFIPLIIPLLHWRQIVPPVTVTKSRASSHWVSFLWSLRTVFSKWVCVCFVSPVSWLCFLCTSASPPRPACLSDCLPASQVSFPTSPHLSMNPLSNKACYIWPLPPLFLLLGPDQNPQQKKKENLSFLSQKYRMLNVCEFLSLFPQIDQCYKKWLLCF